MPRGPKGEKRPRDVIGTAIMVAKIATGEIIETEDGKDPAAKSMGRRGGKARAASMTPERRQEIARKADPYNQFFPSLLIKHYNDLITIQLYLSDHQGMAQSARAIAAISPERPAEYVTAAACLARAIPLAQADVRMTPAERREVVENYAREAIRMLEAGLARGFSKGEELKTRPEYQPLRRRPDFQRLIDGIEQSKVRNA